MAQSNNKRVFAGGRAERPSFILGVRDDEDRNEWLWATVAIAGMLLVLAGMMALMIFFPTLGLCAEPQDGQQITCNLESVAGWYVGTDGTVHPWSNEPFTVVNIGGVPTVLPDI